MIEQRATEKIHDIRDIRRQIVECLSGVNPKQGQEFNNLVKEVAKAINRGVGQFIEDEVSTQEMQVAGYNSQEYLVNKGWRGYELLPRQVKSAYNISIGKLARAGCFIGQIRNANEEELRVLGLTEMTVRFAKIAFSKPQHKL